LKLTAEEREQFDFIQPGECWEWDLVENKGKEILVVET